MDPATLSDLPRPGPLAVLLGVLRVLAVFGLLIVGTPVVFVAALLPAKRGQPSPALRAAVRVARAFLVITGARLETDAPERMREHRGFVFFNHLSHLDIVALLAVAPVRFLATQGVKSIPFIGWMASAVGTLYVNRGRDESREQARTALRTAVVDGGAPVAVAPEGGIGPGPGVLPLRFGAFEVATDADADVLLVALRFSPPGYAVWKEREWLVGPLWRLCARTEPFTIRLSALWPVLETRPGGSAEADPEALAAEATVRLDAVLVGGALVDGVPRA